MEKRWGLHPALKVREFTFSQVNLSTVKWTKFLAISSLRNLGLSYVPVRSMGNGNCLFNSTTTSCKNVETLCAKKGFTYFHCSQIANLSQKNI